MDIPAPDLKALVEGEVVVAFSPRSLVGEGDEVTLEASEPRDRAQLKPAYQRWSDVEVAGTWTAVVSAVHPATMLDPIAGTGRHILTSIPRGDLIVLRVFDDDGMPVLSDVAFDARRRSLEGALSL